MSTIEGFQDTPRLRHPVAYIFVGVLLGPIFAWAIVSGAWSLPWTRDVAIDMFTRDPWNHALPFALTCGSLAWGLRRRIATGTFLSALRIAVWCSVLGGPIYVVFLMILSFLAGPTQGSLLKVFVFTPLAASVLGGFFGALFLPITLPLT